jgi:hypothetical protein
MNALISLTRRLRAGHGSEIFFAVVGLAWVFCGARLSASATHEIIACLAMSFGVLFLGLSAILGQIRTLSAAWRSERTNAPPPPVPHGYAISIEDAIDSVRTSVRLAERQVWIQSFNASRSEATADTLDDVARKRLWYLRGGILPASLPDSIELIEDGGEYSIDLRQLRYLPDRPH